MGCATGLVKYFVFLANLIFALAGLALLIIGILYKISYSEATNILPQNFGLAPILSIIIGAIVFITAFLGCCGAVKESPCMLTTYSIILLTIFIVQVAIGVYAFIKIKDEHEFRSKLHSSLSESFGKYNTNEAARDTVNVIQRFLPCCGLDGPDSWRLIFHNNSLPDSCCPVNVLPCDVQEPKVYHDSCTVQFYDFIMKKSVVFGGVILGIGVIELLGAFFGLCLSNSIRNHYRRSVYA